MRLIGCRVSAASDAQWSLIADVLPSRTSKQGKTFRDAREVDQRHHLPRSAVGLPGATSPRCSGLGRALSPGIDAVSADGTWDEVLARLSDARQPGLPNMVGGEQSLAAGRRICRMRSTWRRRIERTRVDIGHDRRRVTLPTRNIPEQHSVRRLDGVGHAPGLQPISRFERPLADKRHDGTVPTSSPRVDESRPPPRRV